MDEHSFTPALSAISLLVEDLDAAEAFYRRAFATEPQWHDAKSVGFSLGSIVLNLLLASEGERLLAPATVGTPDSGERSQLSIWVDDIDTVVEVLAGRGVSFDSGPSDQDWGMRTATFRDPDGHSWEIAQDLGN